MTEQEKAYHAALSQCAELLDNMKDGAPITDTPKYLAAKLNAKSVQVLAAEVRAQALRDAEEAADDAYLNAQCSIERGEFSQPIRQTREAISAAIRSLAQSSTADKASEVRAAVLNAQADAIIGFAMSLADCGLCSKDPVMRLANGAAERIRNLAAPSTADSGNTSDLGEGVSDA